MSRIQLLSLGVLFGLSTACSYDEGLLIENMVGTVVIPGDLVERTYNIDGEQLVVRDVRAIGPVFLGLYSGMEPENVVEEYPHPSVGPAFDAAEVGDAYPYGGITIGTLRSDCLEVLQCATVTGRFKTYDEVVVWFRDYLDEPILDWYGNPIETGEQLRNVCFTAFDYASDAELGLVVSDGNDDGVVDDADLDFIEREDGHFEADFTIFQQEWFDNEDTGEGFTLYGFMDSPALGDGKFSTCIGENSDEENFGENIDQYNQDFVSGSFARTILNRPSNYIGPGDLVSGVQEDTGSIGYTYETIYDIPELWLNHEVQQ